MIPTKVSIELGQRMTVRGEWESFSGRVFNGVKPSELQLEETKKAFYEGQVKRISRWQELKKTNA